MKRNNILHAILVWVVMLLPLTSCGTDNPEILPEPEPEPVVPEPEPTPVEDQYGIDATAAISFFASRIKGSEGTYETAGALTAENIDEATAYVWSLWKAAVNTNDVDKLPAPAPVNGWYATAPIHFTWNVGSTPMSCFFGKKGTQPTAGYPLVLFLHGSGNDATQEWKNMLYLNDASVEYPTPSVYLIPKSPNGGTGCRWFTPTRQLYWERIIRQALLRDDIDRNKIYISGISEGAYGTQRLASFYADYLAAVSPISGGEQLFQCPPENLANVYYHHVNGSEDTMYGRYILTNKVKAELDRLEQEHAGYYAHNVKIISGAPHFDLEFINDYTVTPELVKHSRKANPKYFYWENYGMGGQLGEGYRYREGFYNIRVLESESGKADNMKRDCYEMTIGDDNVIDLNINVVTVTPSDVVKNEYWELATSVSKSYTPATKGKVRIYLNKNLVDLTKPVIVKVNGQEKFNGTVSLDSRWLIESCGLFFDPERLFPAAIDIAL